MSEAGLVMVSHREWKPGHYLHATLIRNDRGERGLVRTHVMASKSAPDGLVVRTSFVRPPKEMPDGAAIDIPVSPFELHQTPEDRMRLESEFHRST